MAHARCRFDGCNDHARSRGYCHRHYMRLAANGTLERPGDRGCRRRGCPRAHYARGLCAAHYKRIQAGSKDASARIRKMGAGNLTTDGYRRVRAPGHANAHANGSIMEHRLVMSRALARPLFDDEEVHHRNGDRADNRLENLELWSRSHPCGQRVEDLLSWARDIIQRYGAMADVRRGRDR